MDSADILVYNTGQQSDRGNMTYSQIATAMTLNAVVALTIAHAYGWAAAGILAALCVAGWREYFRMRRLKRAAERARLLLRSSFTAL